MKRNKQDFYIVINASSYFHLLCILFRGAISCRCCIRYPQESVCLQSAGRLFDKYFNGYQYMTRKQQQEQNFHHSESFSD